MKGARVKSHTRATSLHPRLIAITGIATALLLLSGCAAAVDPSKDNAPVAAFAHIHALAVDPTSGELLVATHEGIYALDPNAVTATGIRGPLGGLDFDPMGFTVLGATAYASGHPGPSTPAEFGAPNLGLIRSDDGGVTWTTLALRGETDFHVVTAGAVRGDAPDVIYGLDSGSGVVRISDDGGYNWVAGAAVPARTILADPIIAKRIYATTADGLAVSADGALTFTIDTSAPVLYLIAADQAGGLVGIDTVGDIWSRATSGPWAAGGAVNGTVQAIIVDGNRLYVADDRGVVYTDDRGETWVVLAPTG